MSDSMTLKKVVPASLIASAALVIAGCSTGPTAAQKAEMVKPNNDFNFLGIVKYEEAVFSERHASTFPVNVDEITVRDNYSGDRVSLLWGLVTLNDY